MSQNSLKGKELVNRIGISDAMVSESEQNDELAPIEVRIPLGLGLTGSDEKSKTRIGTGERKGSPHSKVSSKEIISRKASRSKSKFTKGGNGLQALGPNSGPTSKRIVTGSSDLITRKPISKKPKKSPQKKKKNQLKTSPTKPKTIPSPNFPTKLQPKTHSPALSKIPIQGRKNPNLDDELMSKFGSDRRQSTSQQPSSEKLSNFRFFNSYLRQESDPTLIVRPTSFLMLKKFSFSPEKPASLLWAYKNCLKAKD
jgi:hypothetical protein